MKELLTSDLKNAILTMIMGPVEFGKEVAVPLKEAIRKIRGVTLVDTLPTGGDAATVRLQFNPATSRSREYVGFPGEVLFVGFSPPIYSPDNMARVIERVAKIAGGEIEVEGPGAIDRDVFRLGSMRLTERGQVPFVQNSVATFSADDPLLRDLLRDDLGIEVEKTYRDQRLYYPERTAYVVFYPSKLLAAVACDLGSALKIIHGDETYFSMLGREGFGAMTLVNLGDLQSLDEFATTPRRERRIVQRILSEHHPGYIIPERLAA